MSLRDDDDVVVNKALSQATEVGKKPTHVWVAVAAFVVGLILGLLL